MKKNKKANIFLICGICTKKHQNYRTTKTKKMITQNLKLNLKKHCKFCRKTEIHKEGAVR